MLYDEAKVRRAIKETYVALIFFDEEMVGLADRIGDISREQMVEVGKGKKQTKLKTKI